MRRNQKKRRGNGVKITPEPQQTESPDLYLPMGITYKFIPTEGNTFAGAVYSTKIRELRTFKNFDEIREAVGFLAANEVFKHLKAGQKRVEVTVLVETPQH